MENLFFGLLLISIFLFILGLVSPKSSLFWAKSNQTRGKSSLIYGLSAIIFFVAFGETEENETSELKKEPKTEEVIPSNAPKTIVRNIIQDRKGNIWITSWEGMFRYDGKSFTNVTSKVSKARFFSVLEDRKGNLWFGTIGEGVYRYDGISFQNITTTDGLLNNEVVWIYEDKLGYIWFGTYGGASRYDGKSFRNYIINGDSMSEDKTGKTFPNSPRPPYEVNAIIEDKTGKFWFATRGNAFVYNEENFTVVAHEGIPFKNVRTVIEDRSGNVWLGGQDGLWRCDGNTFTNISSNFGGFVYEDRSGNIVTSSEESPGGSWALSYYDEKSLSSKKPTVTEVKSREGMIFGILEAADGSIWFGTLSGVSRYDGNTITDFRDKEDQ